MRQFAMGAIYVVPSGANPTPIPIATLKSATVDFKQSKKPLRGQWKAPIDFGEGPLDISVKIMHADFRANILAMVIAGTTTAGGSVLAAIGEAGTIPGSPWQIVVTQSATFSEDGGVYDLTAGKWLTRVAAGPTTGQYTVAAGTYTFAAADTAHKLQIVYSYTSATVGQTTNYLNQVQGASTAYAVRLYNVFSIAGVLKPVGLRFPAVHFESLSLNFKAEDWAEKNLEGAVSQDSTSLTVFDYFVGD